MAGSSKHTAYSGLERRPEGGSASAVVCAAVVMFSVVVKALTLGVTVAEGVNVQPAIAGSPPQERVIALVNDPCGVSVRVTVPGCPAVTPVFDGGEVILKSLTWKL